MNITFEVCMVALVITSGAVADWKNLHVKFAAWDGFFDMPTSYDDLKENYAKYYCYMGFDHDLNCSLYSYCQDPRVSVIIDSWGNIGGLRLSYIKEDVGKRAEAINLTFPYNFDNNPMYLSGNYWGIDLWYTSVLFVSPDKLKAGGRKDTGGLVAEGVWLQLDGTWTNITRDECQVETQGFTKQACFLGMGMHYFYKMTPTADCADLPGVFLLYECKQLIGLGIIPFGSFTYKDREWFEDPPPSIVKSIVPHGPPCLSSWINNYGTTSLHIFFKRFPRLTFCIWPWQRSNQCSQTTVY